MKPVKPEPMVIPEPVIESDPILKPGPPFDLVEVVDKTSKDQITVSWKAPIENGGAAIEEYRVWYRKVGESDL